MIRKIDDRIRQIDMIRNGIALCLEGREPGSLSSERDGSSGLSHKREYVLKSQTLKQLRVAGIMDRFTLECFSPECVLKEVTPTGWREEMDAFKPELLFIESAWEGKDGLWHDKINRCAPELYGLADYCHENGIPVVFWNKEDPVYTDTFISTARLADVVFTTEIECVEKYKTVLKHDCVYHLHFAAQPTIHNPIERMERKDKFCFAGAYYHRYEQRSRVFDNFARYFIENKGLDIYDRNYPSPRPEHKFPDKYNQYILGRLDPSEIDVAYKGYTFGINMNSIPQAQTMFARRIFELMASNTIVVGNFGRGIKNYFGDLAISTDDLDTLKRRLEVCESDSDLRKWRLLALRKVLREHLCEDRLDYIVQKVYGRSLKRQLPSILVVGAADDAAQRDRLIAMFERQSYKNTKLLLVGDAPAERESDSITFADKQTAREIRLRDCEQEYIALFNVSDWYGENYLTDMALTMRYGKFSAIGKAAHYEGDDGAAKLVAQHDAYRAAQNLQARAAIVSSDLLGDISAAELTQGQTWALDGMLAIDEFNYCMNWADENCSDAQDMFLADQGIALDRINKTAQSINGLLSLGDKPTLEPDEIARFAVPRGAPVTIVREGREVVIKSRLSEDKHEYLSYPDAFELSSLITDGQLNVMFSGSKDMDFICCCQFLDDKKAPLSPLYPRLNCLERLTPPVEAFYMRLMLRVRGSGTARLKRISFADEQLSANGNCLLLRSDALVLTNNYPSADDLYRNMFVHARVKAYKEAGLALDVVRMHPFAKSGFREYNGINIAEGFGEQLISALTSGTVKTICVHFLDQEMWSILKLYLDQIRLLIWVHGSEIQPWWRREYNYNSKEALDQARHESEKRMKLWDEVFRMTEKYDIHFVFVSQYFADEVMEDYKVELRNDCYSIIHNLINEEIFTYIEKSPDQRKKILTIKSFSSAKYGNDITVKAILELSKRPIFKDIEFNIYGRGEHFNTINKPLRKFSNVRLNDRFLSQSEIADAHKKCGVYIGTTRMDAQGVSRDEAMSSGLVPIANAVAAIPEFVDENCGILVPAEDYKAVADAIERLYNDPELFSRLSKNAAERVRRQSSKARTIDRELELIQTS